MSHFRCEYFYSHCEDLMSVVHSALAGEMLRRIAVASFECPPPSRVTGGLLCGTSTVSYRYLLLDVSTAVYTYAVLSHSRSSLSLKILACTATSLLGVNRAPLMLCNLCELRQYLRGNNVRSIVCKSANRHKSSTSVRRSRSELVVLLRGRALCGDFLRWHVAIALQYLVT